MLNPNPVLVLPDT